MHNATNIDRVNFFVSIGWVRVVTLSQIIDLLMVVSSQSQSCITTDSQFGSMCWSQAPNWDPGAIFSFIF
jgi:hypothetical protein